MLGESAKPREHDRHVLDCCIAKDEQAVFKWSTWTGVRWLSQLRGETGAHPKRETISRMLSGTSILHAATGAETTIVPSSVMGGLLQADPKTQGSNLKTPLGPWHEMSHDCGYEGSFVEFSEPGEEQMLIEVCSSQADCESGGSLLRGWEYMPTECLGAWRSLRIGSTGKRWDDPTMICLEIEPNHQARVHLAKATKGEPGNTDKRCTDLMGGSQQRSWMEMAGNQCRAQRGYSHVPSGNWRAIRSFGIDYKEHSSRPDTHDLIVHLGGTPYDLIDSH